MLDFSFAVVICLSVPCLLKCLIKQIHVWIGTDSQQSQSELMRKWGGRKKVKLKFKKKKKKKKSVRVSVRGTTVILQIIIEEEKSSKKKTHPYSPFVPRLPSRMRREKNQKEEQEITHNSQVQSCC